MEILRYFTDIVNICDKNDPWILILKSKEIKKDLVNNGVIAQSARRMISGVGHSHKYLRLQFFSVLAKFDTKCWCVFLN